MGRTAEVTGTAMRAALNEMNKKLGDSSPRIIGLDKSLLVLNKAMKNGADLSKIFGAESAEAIFALVENRGALQKLRKDIQGTNVAYEQAAIRMKTFSEIMARAWTKFKNILIKGFFIIKPVLVELIKEYIVPLLKWIDSLSPSTKKWVIGILALTAVIGPLAIGLGAIATVISAISLPLTGTIILIGILIASIVYLYKNWDSAMSGMTQSTNAFGGGLDVVIDIFKIIIKTVGDVYNFLSSLIDVIFSLFQVGQDGGKALNTALANMGDSVLSIMDTLKASILTFAQMTLKFLIAPIKSALKLASNLPGFLGGEKATGALQAITAMQESLAQAAADARREALDDSIRVIARHEDRTDISINLKSVDGSSATVETNKSGPNININNMTLGTDQ
jgi:hypothetical protein